MPRIELNTEICAPIDVVFDLSRSIEFHLISAQKQRERAVAGKTSGLMGLNETVTWKAKHCGFTQTLSSEITEFKKPDIFVDEMTRGVFKSFRHAHLFLEEDGKTLMIDIFDFESPLGVLGRTANRLFLRKYLENLLIERNNHLKKIAECGEWKAFISQ